MKRMKKLLTSFLACAAVCAVSVTALAAAPLETRAAETKSYLSAANVKDGGLSEWGLISLAASGVKGDADVIRGLIKTALEDIGENGFTGTAGAYGESAWGSNAGSLAKLILLLNSQGISPYTFGKNGDFEGYDLVAALFNTDHYYKNVSAYDLPYALMVYDALGIPAEKEADYKYSREMLVEKCLGLIGTVDGSVLSNGTADMTGVANVFDSTQKSPYDFESTAMVLQALAPYYTGSKPLSGALKTELDAKVNGCIDSIKQVQTATGGVPYAFFSYDADWNASFEKYADSCDAMAQIILAFTALGIDIDTVDNGGVSMLDNFLSAEYQTGNAGEFHANTDPLTQYYNNLITTQSAYMALAAYQEMAKNGGAAFSLFDRAAPVAYSDYDYSFFYPAQEEDSKDSAPSEPPKGPEPQEPEQQEPESTDKAEGQKPPKVGDPFPAAGVTALLVLCGGSLFLLKRKNAGR
ncbi:MAG: hypothetical protein HFJ85_02545 [Oscillospiraceae bacterium]|nr:hypothetical protein [Oscillospiraceae bacterium]